MLVAPDLERRVVIGHGRRLVAAVVTYRVVGQQGGASLLMRPAALVEGVHILGVQLQRPALVGDGLLELSVDSVGVAAVGVGGLLRRIELQRRGEVGDRPLVLPGRPPDSTALGVRPRVLGVELQGARVRSSTAPPMSSSR